MPKRSDQWHLSGWYVWPLAPFAIILAFALKLFRSNNTEARTPREVEGYIRDFIEGTGGEWDWDDFTSIPIEDARLEAIRIDACEVALPGGPDQIEELRQLLARAEAIQPKVLNVSQKS